MQHFGILTLAQSFLDGLEESVGFLFPHLGYTIAVKTEAHVGSSQQQQADEPPTFEEIGTHVHIDTDLLWLPAGKVRNKAHLERIVARGQRGVAHAVLTGRQHNPFLFIAFHTVAVSSRQV